MSLNPNPHATYISPTGVLISAHDYTYLSDLEKSQCREWHPKEPTKGGTRKIGELPNKFCKHPEHNPASHRVYIPGVYEHVCPACGVRQVFTVSDIRY
jgi:hypothetical protein